MDLGQYLEMFLAECRENLQELNLAVVRLEERPDDHSTVDELFRIAHSLKGMSATMGFEGMAALTHQMEDVLELLRRRADGITPEVADTLLACLDALSSAVDGIEATGAETLDPAPLVARLSALVRQDDEAREAAAAAVQDGLAELKAPAPAPAPAAPPAPVEPQPEPVADTGIRVTVTLADDVMMPSVRAYQVLAALGELVASDPRMDAVERFSGRTITATVTCTDARARLANIGDIAAIEVDGDATSAAVPVPLTAPAIPVAAAEQKSAKAQTVRVDAERLDQLMHYMGELVVHRTKVEALAEGSAAPGLSQAIQELTRSSQALQAMVMQIRMVPIEAVFLRFPRLVRDASSKLGKQVQLDLVGQETELDRTVVDAIGDPLVHLIRNSLDHGLEPAAEREASGKPALGRLTISARHAGGSIAISVRDDGRGVDAARVAAQAVKNGLIPADQAAAVDTARAIELLFAPGFSTADAVGDLSGRGVGLDAVREKIRQLGGEVQMTSEPGHGTEAEIRLPLTLAIMSALLVRAGGKPFGIPLNRVERTLRLEDEQVRSAAGHPMLVAAEGAMPLRRAADAFGVRCAAGEDTHAVIIRGADGPVALSVEGLVGQRELVTRPLPAGIAEGGAVSGAAVLPDGDIVLLADCDRLKGAGSSIPVLKAVA